VKQYGLISLLLGLLTLFLLPVSAQECDGTVMSQTWNDFASALRDEQNPIKTLEEMAGWLETNRLSCQEQALRLPPSSLVSEEQPALSFTSMEEGEQAVIGPLTIPDGFYRVRLISSVQAMMHVVERKGTCTIINSRRGEFSVRNVLYMDQSAEVSEFLFDAVACEALLITGDLAINPWQIDFYLLDLTEISPVETTYSSEVLGTSPLIGPIVFEDGVYAVTLTGSSPYVSLFPIEGDCGLLPSNRLLPNGDSKSETKFESQGCVTFITFDLSDQAWQMEFELER
jgi:hypothetical protein